MWQALKQVFSRTSYTISAVVVAVFIFSISLWLPNLPLITQIVTEADMSFFGVLLFLFTLLGSVTTSFTVLSASILAITASLIGVYVSLVMYHLRQRGGGRLSFGTGFIGLLSGLIGVGCVACGSLLLTSLLSFGTATAILGFLPLKGMEFSMIGIILLVASIAMIAREINGNRAGIKS
jgi:hypothetical protein